MTTARTRSAPTRSSARSAEPGRRNNLHLLGWIGAGVAVAAGAALLFRSGLAGRRAAVKRPAPWRRAPVEVVNSIIIDASPDDLYRRWRDLEKLPRFMHHLDRVEVRDERHSRWTAKGPAGLQVAWEAEIVEDKPGELLAWRSLPGSDVDTFGRVEFRATPGGRGTKVRVETRYKQEIQQSLRTLKQAVETGEILRSDSAPGGPMRPARPNPEVARAQIDTQV